MPRGQPQTLQQNPDAGQLRRAFVGLPFRLHERLGRGRHVLFGFVDDDGTAPALADMLNLLRDMFGDAASGFAIAPKDQMLCEREDLPLLSDAGGEFVAEFLARPGMAWLVRPDGYIGWCSDVPSVVGLRSFLAVIAQVPAADMPKPRHSPPQ